MTGYEIKDLNFVTEEPKSQIVVVPTILSQETLREAFLPVYNRIVAEEYGNNEVLRELDKQGRGSNPFIVGLSKKILAPYGVKPVVSADDRNRQVSKMVKLRYYTDFQDLVVHSSKHTYYRDKKLLQNLIETVEEKVGNVKFPFKVTGMITVPWEEDSEEGYGLRFVPTDDFDYVSDKRLNEESGSKFDNVDEKGIPKFTRNGSRRWYSKSNGLSRLYLNRNLDLDSDDDNLAYSNDNGRVVLK
ncbi:MAG: hypothetical protein ABIB79_00955 [archaeon]